MSLNKVLNRPLFREQALRKGALKPIRADIGQMIGGPYSTGQQQMNPRTPVPAIRPNIFKRAIGDVKSFAQRPTQFFSPKTSRFTPGAGTGSLLAYGGILPLVQMGRRKLGIQDDSGLATAIDFVLPAAISLNPYGRAAGLALQAGRFGLGALDYVRNQPIGTTREKIFPQSLGEPLGLFGPVDLRETRKERRDRKKLERQAQKEGSEGEIVTDQLTKPDQSIVVNNKPIGDLNEIVTNTAQLPPEKRQDGPTGMEGSPELASSKPEAPVEEPEEEKKANARLEKEAVDLRAGRIPGTDNVLQLAREYYNEINEGQPLSQAKNVFLATLASGLMAGTTKKQGIGGALEVMGQALGPAVNNYATLALKEGEIRAKNREASLSAALDHMKLLNTGAKSPDRTAGVIQYRTADGELRNIGGFQLKDGTIQRPVVGEDGRQTFVTVPQGGPIVGPNGEVLGQVQQFRAQKDIGKRLFDIEDVLGNRYTAYSTTLDVLKTLNRLTPEGESVKAGAALTVDAFLRRTTGVARELLGIEIGDTRKEAEQKLQEYYDDEVAAIERDPDLSPEQKKKEISELLNKDSLIKEAKKRLKKNTGWYSGLTRDEQEKLAVQEVSLIYALANTFKDQDRLTQRDINAAREIVNIFSLSRSSKDVKASIEAIGRQLEADILRQERLYTSAGGLYGTILDLRQLKNFNPATLGGITPALEKAFTDDQIRDTLEGVNL